MKKKQYNFRIKPEVYKVLKLMSVEYDKYIGDMIEDLIYSFEQQEDKKWKQENSQ